MSQLRLLYSHLGLLLHESLPLLGLRLPILERKLLLGKRQSLCISDALSFGLSLCLLLPPSHVFSSFFPLPFRLYQRPHFFIVAAHNLLACTCCAFLPVEDSHDVLPECVSSNHTLVAGLDPCFGRPFQIIGFQTTRFGLEDPAWDLGHPLRQ